MGLRKRLESIETELRRLAETHATKDDVAGVRDAVSEAHETAKAARADLKGLTTTTQTGLKGVTEGLAGVLAQAAEVVSGPPPKKANGKPATPTSASKENS